MIGKEFFDAVRGSLLKAVWMVAPKVALPRSPSSKPLGAEPEGLFRRQAGADSVIEGAISNPVMPSGCAHGMEVKPVNIYGDKGTSVLAALDLRGNPATVTGLVITGRGHAVNLIFRGRFWSHVGKELLIRSIPFRAYPNAFCTIPSVVLAAFIRASTLNPEPCFVFGRRI